MGCVSNRFAASFCALAFLFAGAVDVLAQQVFPIDLVQTVSSDSVSAPGQLQYNITVTNSGNAELTGLVMRRQVEVGSVATDLPNLSLVSGDTDNDNVLDAGEKWEYQATYDVTQADIDQVSGIRNIVYFDSDQTTEETSGILTSIARTPGFDMSAIVHSGPSWMLRAH